MILGVRQMIRRDKDGRYVTVKGEKFYIDDESVDDVISLISSLRQIEKIALKFEDEELSDVISKKIAYYSEVLKEIYSD